MQDLRCFLGKKSSFYDCKDDLLATTFDQYQSFFFDKDHKKSILDKILNKYFNLKVNETSMALIDWELQNTFDDSCCSNYSLTYSYVLNLNLAIVNSEKSLTKKIMLCQVPRLTDRGSFIINGVEKVIINQFQRASGLSFVTDNNDFSQLIKVQLKKGKSFSLQLKHSKLYFLVDDCRIPLTHFLKFIGFSNQEIAQLDNDQIHLKFNERGNLELIKSQIKPLSHFPLKLIDNQDNQVFLKQYSNLSYLSLLDAYRLKNSHLELIIDEKSIINLSLIDDSVITSELLSTKKSNYEDLVVNGYNRNLISNQIDSSDDDINSSLVMLCNSLNLPYSGSYEDSIKSIQEYFFNYLSFDELGRDNLNFYTKAEITSDTYSDDNDSCLNREDIFNICYQLIRFQSQHDEHAAESLANRKFITLIESLTKIFNNDLYKLNRKIIESINNGLTSENEILKLIKGYFSLDNNLRSFMNTDISVQMLGQINALTELSHKRRVSQIVSAALRDKMGMSLRDIHHSHYGRICPIETPEGGGIGLINNLALGAIIDNGSIKAPFRKVINGKVTQEIYYLKTLEQYDKVITSYHDYYQGINNNEILGYKNDSLGFYKAEDINYIDAYPIQMISASVSLIPFIQHNLPDRALMGSNMQKQALPLIKGSSPIVGTGTEKKIAIDSRHVILAKNDGVVVALSMNQIVIKTDNKLPFDYYELLGYCVNNNAGSFFHKALVKVGDKVKAGDLLADSSSTSCGELAIGNNIRVAYASIDGYNYEDSVVISQSLVKSRALENIYCNEYLCMVHNTNMGTEEITPDLPWFQGIENTKAINLNSEGIVTLYTEVNPGDILVGKITPQPEQLEEPEDRLLRAIFGEKPYNYKNSSLILPKNSSSGVVTKIVRINKKEIVELIDNQEKDQLLLFIYQYIVEKCNDDEVATMAHNQDLSGLLKIKDTITDSTIIQAINQLESLTKAGINKQEACRKIRNFITFNLFTNVIEIVKVQVTSTRNITIGDKITGRHGNKGVISAIFNEEDMPYDSNGRPVDMIMTPLGIPSRMNIGQLYECVVGSCLEQLGTKLYDPIVNREEPKVLRNVLNNIYNETLHQDIDFDQYNDEDIKAIVQAAQYGIKSAFPSFNKDTEESHDFLIDLMKRCGKLDQLEQLYDGRTGKPLDNKCLVGPVYVLKLDHVVDNKIHARAVGPYSLITQQPLGGKSYDGGQRLGEMEVNALQAYGATNLVKELMTVKSDAIQGRNEMYRNIVFGHDLNDIEIQNYIPESFNVLCNELRALCIEIKKYPRQDQHNHHTNEHQ